MRSLCNAVQLLPSLWISIILSTHTVAAGSPLGFGPLFFGPASKGKSLFSSEKNIQATPGDPVEEPEVLSLGAGKGQSFP
jgi:hypothetical protein